MALEYQKTAGGALRVNQTLQQQTNSLSTGLGTNWVNVAGSASITSTNITIDPAKPTVFYRLILP